MSRRNRGPSFKRTIGDVMRRGCENKVRYEFEHEVKWAIANAKKEFNLKLKIYNCKFCGGFHTAKVKKWTKTKNLK